jgi:anaerobic magnesium-protoporphyrin IX monomethyl ester cyclase
MKVLLINPPFLPEYGRYSRTSRSPAITKSGTLYYPFWLLYGAAALERAGCEIDVVDAPAVRLGAEAVAARARELGPDLVVLDTSTPSVEDDKLFAAYLKDAAGGPFVVLVGTHVTARPEDGLAEPAVDAVCVGEYDRTLVELAAALSTDGDWRSIRGLAYRSNGKVIENERQPLLEELDGRPYLAEMVKKYLRAEDYFFAAARYPMVMMITGRGCPHRCVFCLYPQVFHGNKYRLRSPADVVDEFDFIANELPRVREVVIEDDTFSANKKRVKEICALLVERRVKIRWSANVRANLDYETMVAMRRAGCRLIIVGYESGDQRVLDMMNKDTTLEQQLEFARAARRAGLLVHGCFMVGTPGETRESLERTLDFAIKLAPDTAQFFPLMVYPGTRAYQWAEENGYLTTSDFREWVTAEGLHDCVVSTEALTAEELVEFCDYARRSFYLRPGYIIRKAFQSVLHPSEGLRTFLSFRVFAKHLFRRR